MCWFGSRPCSASILQPYGEIERRLRGHTIQAPHPILSQDITRVEGDRERMHNDMRAPSNVSAPMNLERGVWHVGTTKHK